MESINWYDIISIIIQAAIGLITIFCMFRMTNKQISESKKLSKIQYRQNALTKIIEASSNYVSNYNCLFAAINNEIDSFSKLEETRIYYLCMLGVNSCDIKIYSKIFNCDVQKVETSINNIDKEFLMKFKEKKENINSTIDFSSIEKQLEVLQNQLTECMQNYIND